jgi:hypothetical protein
VLDQKVLSLCRSTRSRRDYFQSCVILRSLLGSYPDMSVLNTSVHDSRLICWILLASKLLCLGHVAWEDLFQIILLCWFLFVLKENRQMFSSCVHEWEEWLCVPVVHIIYIKKHFFGRCSLLRFSKLFWFWSNPAHRFLGSYLKESLTWANKARCLGSSAFQWEKKALLISTNALRTTSVHLFLTEL